MIENWLGLADIHEGDKSIGCIDIVKQVCKDITFNKIIFMGDCVNYDGISKYTLKDYSSGVDECEEELTSFKETFKDIIGSAKLEESDCIFTMGNHDGERVDTLLSKLKAKNLNREYRDVKKSLDFKSNFPGAKIIPYGEYLKKNGLAITHCEPRMGTDNHSKAMATRYGCDVLYGHYHKLQVYSVSQKDRDKAIKGYSIPCMCDLRPQYEQNSGNAWTNGFSVITFHNGTYSLEMVEIKNNKCMFRGKLYETQKDDI
jgi:Icc-related predicted phosphoesterase